MFPNRLRILLRLRRKFVGISAQNSGFLLLQLTLFLILIFALFRRSSRAPSSRQSGLCSPVPGSLPDPAPVKELRPPEL